MCIVQWIMVNKSLKGDGSPVTWDRHNSSARTTCDENEIRTTENENVAGNTRYLHMRWTATVIPTCWTWPPKSFCYESSLAKRSTWRRNLSILFLPELDSGGAIVSIFEFLSGLSKGGHHTPANFDAATSADPVTFAHQLQRRLQHLDQVGVRERLSLISGQRQQQKCENDDGVKWVTHFIQQMFCFHQKLETQFLLIVIITNILLRFFEISGWPMTI